MLNTLKTLLEADERVAVETDDIDMASRIEATNIRDMFLSGTKEIVSIGGDSDPTINKFIDSIPEDEELSPIPEKEIEKIAENLVPVLNEAYEDESDSSIDDFISSDDYDDIDEPDYSLD